MSHKSIHSERVLKLPLIKVAVSIAIDERLVINNKSGEVASAPDK